MKYLLFYVLSFNLFCNFSYGADLSDHEKEVFRRFIEQQTYVNSQKVLESLLEAKSGDEYFKKEIAGIFGYKST